MNDVRALLAKQSANPQCCGDPPAPRGNGPNRNACTFRVTRKQGIAHRDYFGGMPARAKALQEQQGLMLSSTILAAQVDDERVHKEFL